jgi:hypothetical protein
MCPDSRKAIEDGDFRGAWFLRYPGDPVARAWAQASPYRFLVFPVGGLTGESWRGRTVYLRGLGWGLAMLYAPRGSRGSGDRANPTALTRSAGAADGYDAVARCRAEGVGPSTVCYLDLADLSAPHGGSPHCSVACGWQDYHQGWLGAVLDSGTIQPATRCHDGDERNVVAALRTAFRERGRQFEQPRLWIVATDGPRRGTRPRENRSTLIDDEREQQWPADIWQVRQGLIREQYGGTALSLARCRAATSDPSFGTSPIDPAAYAAALRPGVMPAAQIPVTGAVLDSHQLMLACLGLLTATQGDGAVASFPRGVSAVEVETSAHNGTTTTRIRVVGAGD